MKPILDACFGGRMFYFDKNDPRVLFQDIRSEESTLCDGRSFKVEPDVIGDFTSMDFPDNTFRMVVFDPPHLRWWGKDPEKEPTGFQEIKYGILRDNWKDTMSKAFAECFRVLKPGGFLIFKWSEHDIKLSTILKLTDQKPIFDHKSGKRANTHWVCFMKAGAVQVENPWLDAEKVQPKDHHMVLVKVELDESQFIDGAEEDICYTTAYYENGHWQFPDDWYYDLKVLQWMPIPKSSKTQNIADVLLGQDWVRKMTREELVEIASSYADFVSEENREGFLECLVQFLEYVTDEYNFLIVDRNKL